MSQHDTSPIDQDKLQTLHDKVDAMLDIPMPKEGDEFPLPVEVIAPLEPHADNKISVPAR